MVVPEYTEADLKNIYYTGERIFFRTTFEVQLSALADLVSVNYTYSPLKYKYFLTLTLLEKIFPILSLNYLINLGWVH